MMLRNRVFTLQITALTPLHIGTGTRLAADLDYYADGATTYMLDSDVALELALQRWEADRLSPDEQRRQAEAALDEDAARLLRRRERNVREIEAFPTSPPQDRRKLLQWEQQQEKLRSEAGEVRAAMAQLKARRAALANQVFADSAGLPDALVGGSGFADLLKTDLLTLADIRARADVGGRPLVRYALDGRPAAGEIFEQIKDVADHMYLPGSSLKGAIRSALAWDLAPNRAARELMALTGGGEKTADNKIEEQIFLGRDLRRMNATVRDVMRTLHVADSAPLAATPELLSVAIFRSASQRNARLAVEAIPAGAALRATLQVERYPFESAEARKVLEFGDWQARLAPEALAAACRRRAEALIAGEQAYFARFPEAAELVRFYKDLRDTLTALEPRSFVLPVGWGAGWRSKTLDDRLRGEGDADAPFVEAVRRFKLKKHKSPGFEPGGSFPDTRKLAMAGERPARPLGWLQVAISEERQR